MTRCAAFAVLASLLAVSTQSATVTPIQQVISMLDDMAQKGKDEKHKEEVAFAEFEVFCSQTSKAKSKAITEATDAIAAFGADISKAQADANKLGDDVRDLDADIATWDSEMKSVTAVRNKEESEYQAQHKDYSESVSALERAIKALEATSGAVPQAASFIQLQHLPKEAEDAFKAYYLQTEQEETQAPAAAAYKSHGSGIIATFEQLLEKFKGERSGLEKEEIKKKHSFELIMQGLTDDTNAAEKTRTDKVAAKTGRLQDASEAQRDMQETAASKQADEAYLKDLVMNCATKSKEFKERQVLRAEEIEAIEKAKEIIASPEVAGAGSTHLPSMLQTKSTALAQMRSYGDGSVNVASFLMQRAKQTGSRFLSSIANRAAQDPFAKVKKMIEDLLAKLMQEASEEADHKGWCDSELGANRKTRDDLTAQAESLQSTVDELTAKKGKLTQEISDLGDAISDLNDAITKATEQRNQEKETNAQTVEDAVIAKNAVMRALKVLSEFYAKAGSATSLAQQTPPKTFNKPYTGMQGANGGVVGMLEVIQSDFERLEAETKATEMSNQSEYDRFMSDSTADKDAKEKQQRHRGYEKDTTTRKLNDATSDLASTQEELVTANQYFEKLKPSCLDDGLSYEDRVEQREAEIQSLKEALEILQSEELR